MSGVHAFLDRPLAGEWPYLWLDATYLKQHEGGRIVAVAAIIAVAANSEGRREIVGRISAPPRPRPPPSRGQALLVEFSEEPDAVRSARCQAGGLRRP
jgi:hypothetical protein